MRVRLPLTQTLPVACSMLETGNGLQAAHANGKEGDMNLDESITEFSIWAIAASPLVVTTPIFNCSASQLAEDIAAKAMSAVVDTEGPTGEHRSMVCLSLSLSDSVCVYPTTTTPTHPHTPHTQVSGVRQWTHTQRSRWMNPHRAQSRSPNSALWPSVWRALPSAVLGLWRTRRCGLRSL